MDFQNGIDLNGGVRNVRVDHGNIPDHALISGAADRHGWLAVIGDGSLELTNTGNNYSRRHRSSAMAPAASGNLILSCAGALSPNSNLQINGATAHERSRTAAMCC